MQSEGEPTGLNLSLDDIIQQSRQQHDGNKRGRGGRRGGAGPVRHRHEGNRDNRGHRGGRHNDRHHGGGGGHGHGRPRANEIDYKQLQKCYTDDTGTTIFEYRGVHIVSITPAGDITMDVRGYYNDANIASLNDALNPIGIRVTAPNGDVRSGQWSISDGKSLTRFEDGVILPGKGDVTRGIRVMEAFKNPHRAAIARATAASNAAAENAGLLHGYVPPPGYGGRGRGRGRGRGGSHRFAPY